jgi:hypothetical protein
MGLCSSNAAVILKPPGGFKRDAQPRRADAGPSVRHSLGDAHRDTERGTPHDGFPQARLGAGQDEGREGGAMLIVACCDCLID